VLFSEGWARWVRVRAMFHSAGNCMLIALQCHRVGGVTRALYSIITVAILAAGELWGLWVLAESSEKTSSPNLVVGAIAFGLVAASVAALRREASGE